MRWDEIPAFPRLFSAANPAERIAAESEEIPIIAQFSPKGGNGAVMGISSLSARKRFAGSRVEGGRGEYGG